MILFGVALRLWRLDGRGFWFDEVLGMLRSLQPTVSGILHAPPRVEPPLYYLLQHVWLLQGRDEATARALPALLSALGLWLAWRAYRRLLPGNEALSALGLLACSPFQLIYAQEARPYALRQALELTAFLTLLRAAGGGRVIDWAAWAGLNALGGLTHYLSVLWIPCQWAFLLLGGARGEVLGRAGGWGAVAAVPAAWPVVLGREAITLTSAMGWRPVGAVEAVEGLLQTFGGGPFVPAAVAPEALWLFAALAALGLFRAGRERQGRGGWSSAGAATVAFAVLLPAAVVATNWAGLLNRFKVRYAIGAQVFVLAACVRGAGLLPPLAARVAITALLILQLVADAVYLGGGPPRLDLPPYKKPFREAAAFIAAGARDGDAVMAIELTAYLPLRWYLGGAMPVSYAWREPSFTPSELDQIGWPTPLDRACRGRNRLWLVMGPSRFTDPFDVPPAIAAGLRRWGELDHTAELAGIRVERWHRTP